MLQDIKSYCISDKEYNEDTFYYDTDYMFVLDGATGLGNNNHMHTGDDATWFVNQVKDYLITHIQEDRSIASILKDSILEIQKVYPTNVERIDMPSACISLFRIKDNILEYYGLGDSVAIIETTYGLEEFSDSHLENLDASVKKHMAQIAKELHIPFLQTRQIEEIKEHLIKNRNLRNTKDGYYSLDVSGEGIEHAMYKTWNIQDVKRIACMSDGFHEILDHNIYKDIQCVLDALDVNKEIVEKALYDAQEKDNYCENVHRFKKRDDTTYVYAKIKAE